MTDDIIRQHAYHEAGHYTAAMVMAARLDGVFRLEFKSCRLIFDDDGGLRGETRSDLYVTTEEDVEPVVSDDFYINIGLAGLSAQAFLISPTRDVTALSALAQVIADSDARNDMEQLKERFPNVDWSKWRKTHLPCVLKMVRENWGRIERVAEALLDAHRIDGVQEISEEEALAAFKGA